MCHGQAAAAAAAGVCVCVCVCVFVMSSTDHRTNGMRAFLVTG